MISINGAPLLSHLLSQFSLIGSELSLCEPQVSLFLAWGHGFPHFFVQSRWREIVTLICFLGGGGGGLGRSSRFALSLWLWRALSWTIGGNHWREVVGITGHHSQKGLLTCCFVSIFLRASGFCIVTAWMPGSQVWPLWFCVFSLTHKENDFMFPSHMAGPSRLRPPVYASIKFQGKGVCVWSLLRSRGSTPASPSCSIRAAHFRWQLTIFLVMAILSLLGDINCSVTVR